MAHWTKSVWNCHPTTSLCLWVYLGKKVICITEYESGQKGNLSLFSFPRCWIKITQYSISLLLLSETSVMLFSLRHWRLKLVDVKYLAKQSFNFRFKYPTIIRLLMNYIFCIVYKSISCDSINLYWNKIHTRTYIFGLNYVHFRSQENISTNIVQFRNLLVMLVLVFRTIYKKSIQWKCSSNIKNKYVWLNDWNTILSNYYFCLQYKMDISEFCYHCSWIDRCINIHQELTVQKFQKQLSGKKLVNKIW